MFTLLTLSASASLVYTPRAQELDLAAPHTKGLTERLSSSPNIHITHDFLSSSAVAHLLSKVPKDEAKYEPCIGQTEEFASKKCTLLPTEGDEVAQALIAKIGSTWDIDTALLAKGLPIIRYLPGAPPVGKHGDEDRHGVVPNATLVLYLTASDVVAGAATGQTLFPEANVAVTPRQGSVLSFQNVDELGNRHPHGKHSVSAVPKEAKQDRIVMQIPIAHKAGKRAYAYPEHVSGNKKPGQHESIHGNADQKAAYAAAIAAGLSVAAAYLAAKEGKFDEADKERLEKATQVD